jgi:molybdopterin converting factor small subunit
VCHAIAAELSQMGDEIGEELYRRVCNVAANESLETEEENLKISDEDLKILYQVPLVS